MTRMYVVIEGEAKDASWIRRGSGERGVGVHSEQADTRWVFSLFLSFVVGLMV